MQKPKTTEQRHISQQPVCRFYQSTCTINTALQQCMLYLTVEVRSFLTKNIAGKLKLTPSNQDNRTQALTMDEWTSFSQVAFTFMASNYRRNHTQHPREYADIKNRRHTNLQPNLQYTAYLRGLQTILIVEKTASKYNI